MPVRSIGSTSTIGIEGNTEVGSGVVLDPDVGLCIGASARIGKGVHVGAGGMVSAAVSSQMPAGMAGLSRPLESVRRTSEPQAMSRVEPLT